MIDRIRSTRKHRQYAAVMPFSVLVLYVYKHNYLNQWSIKWIRNNFWKD